MRIELHCIARIHVVYLKEVDPLASLMVYGIMIFPPKPPSPRSTETKCRADANSSSRKKEFTKSRSLTNTNLIENTNRNVFYVYFPRLRCYHGLYATNRIIQISLQQTQVLEKISETQQSTKDRSENEFQECITAWISSR